MTKEEYVNKYLDKYKAIESTEDFREFAGEFIIDLSLEVKKFATHSNKQVFIDRLLKVNHKGNKVVEELENLTSKREFTRDFFLKFWCNKLGIEVEGE